MANINTEQLNEIATKARGIAGTTMARRAQFNESKPNDENAQLKQQGIELDAAAEIGALRRELRKLDPEGKYRLDSDGTLIERKPPK